MVRIDKRFLFGYELVKYGGFWIPISDLEKTAIDLAYFRIPIRPELMDKLRKNINFTKLKMYLNKYNPEFRRKVIRELKKWRWEE